MAVARGGQSRGHSVQLRAAMILARAASRVGCAGHAYRLGHRGAVHHLVALNRSRGLSRSSAFARGQDAPNALAAAEHSARGDRGRTRSTRSCLGNEGRGGGKEPVGWKCVQGCGACCLLDKGPLAPPIEEILTDTTELEQYWSMVGDDGWCKLFDKNTRACTVYEDRPRFCRVEAAVFEDLYGIPAKSLNRVARRFCIDSIGDVYGKASPEMQKFKSAS